MSGGSFISTLMAVPVLPRSWRAMEWGGSPQKNGTTPTLTVGHRGGTIVRELDSHTTDLVGSPAPPKVS